MLKLLVKLTLATIVAIVLMVWGLSRLFGFDTNVNEAGMWPFILCMVGVVVITVGLAALQFYSHSSGHDDTIDESHVDK